MVKIRKFKKADTKETAELMVRVFLEFTTTHANQHGIDYFLAHIDPTKTSLQKIEEILDTPIAFNAYDKNKLIGTIRGTPDRILGIYIDKKYQHHGLGKKLVDLFESRAIKLGSTHVKVRSASIAWEFYQKLGYKKTTGFRRFHGIKMIPMKKML